LFEKLRRSNSLELEQLLGLNMNLKINEVIDCGFRPLNSKLTMVECLVTDLIRTYLDTFFVGCKSCV